MWNKNTVQGYALCARCVWLQVSLARCPDLGPWLHYFAFSRACVQVAGVAIESGGPRAAFAFDPVVLHCLGVCWSRGWGFGAGLSCVLVMEQLPVRSQTAAPCPAWYELCTLVCFLNCIFSIKKTLRLTASDRRGYFVNPLGFVLVSAAKSHQSWIQSSVQYIDNCKNLVYNTVYNDS